MSDEKIPVTRGSGNVFADLELPDADLLLAKARMTAKLEAVMADENLSQTEVSRRSGTTQPKVSRMLSGKGRGYTLDKIIETLNTLGCNVEIRVMKSKGSARGQIIVKS